MEIDDLKQRITQGENTTTEFKESFDQEVIETAVAFANTDGGTIFIGVSDKAESRGITIGKETLRDVSNRIAQATEPRVIVEVESVDVAEKSVLLIHIAETSIKPVSVKGRCYKRVGNSNRVMSPQEIAQMHLNAIGQSWDQLFVTRAGMDDIDKKKVEWYLTRRETIRMQRHGQIATKKYVEINHVSRQTAYAELTDLINKGLFTVVGKGRGTKYIRKVTD